MQASCNARPARWPPRSPSQLQPAARTVARMWERDRVYSALLLTLMGAAGTSLGALMVVIHPKMQFQRLGLLQVTGPGDRSALQQGVDTQQHCNPLLVVCQGVSLRQQLASSLETGACA